MDLKKLFTRRVNVLFGFACLLPVVSTLVSMPYTLYVVITGEMNTDSGAYFWLGFIFAQLLYPVLSSVLFMVVLKILKFRISDTVDRKKGDAAQYFTYVPMLLMISYLLSMVVNVIFTVLAQIGIELPTVEGMLPSASTPIEIILFIFVMAVLPAICEEFIFRVVFLGTLSPISAGGAIVVSSIAFGMMHATVEQIPFAFCLGIALAWAYKKTGNYRIPVIVHFINNFLSCVFTLLMDFLPLEIYEISSAICMGAIFLCGIVATVCFFITREKNKPEPSLPQVRTGEGVVLAMKAPMFWVFMAVYVFMTIVNTLSFMMA